MSPDPRTYTYADDALRDRIILITGASDGIGKALALEAARLGAQVILHGRNSKKLEAVYDEIEAMVSDAESHAEEDRKFRELVDARNKADGLIHAAEKTLNELGDKATSEERLQIENAVSDVKSALEGNDKEQIEAKTAALAEASGGLAQRLYEQQSADAGAEESSGNKADADDDVVDAEFEEVDDESKAK